MQLCPERSAGEGQQAPAAHIASLFSRWLVWDGPSSLVTLLGKREPKDMRIRAGYTAKGLCAVLLESGSHAGRQVGLPMIISSGGL